MRSDFYLFRACGLRRDAEKSKVMQIGSILYTDAEDDNQASNVSFYQFNPDDYIVKHTVDVSLKRLADSPTPSAVSECASYSVSVGGSSAALFVVERSLETGRGETRLLATGSGKLLVTLRRRKGGMQLIDERSRIEYFIRRKGRILGRERATLLVIRESERPNDDGMGLRVHGKEVVMWLTADARRAHGVITLARVESKLAVLSRPKHPSGKPLNKWLDSCNITVFECSDLPVSIMLAVSFFDLYAPNV